MRKRNKELERKAHFYEDVVDEVVDEVELTDACPQCNKGMLSEMDFVHVVVTKCNLCEYQKTRKP